MIVLQNKLRMVSFFIFGSILFFYYWYFYFSYAIPPRRPDETVPQAAEVYRKPQLVFDRDSFQFQIDHRTVWKETIPEGYASHDGRIVEQDACHGIADGGQVRATGPILYHYLKDHPDVTAFSRKHDTSAGAAVVRDESVFYFACQNQRIASLHLCPSGHVFRESACEPIQPCTGEKDGTILANPNDLESYVYCQDGRGVVQPCPADTFFLLHHCIPKTDLSFYCRFRNESFLMNDAKTRVDCVDGQPVYTTCPEGYKYFHRHGDCESTLCEHFPDGTRIPMDRRVIDPFTFHPGYVECRGGRVSQSIECPATWNRDDPENLDHLMHLPMVFDGQKCVVPTFCTTVEAAAEDVYVPLYEFRRDIVNWTHASFYDTLEGYTCDGKKRKRVLLPPGQRINKRFKCDSACDARDRIPILDQPHQYFDCVTQTVETCPEGEKFNGIECQLSLSHPFRYRHIDLFQLDSLSHDHWIVPWGYADPKLSVFPCLDPDAIYIENYNVCSHPDCTLYPFLSQLPSLPIALRGFQCVYDPTDRTVKRSETLSHFDFWSQRPLTVAAAENSTCQMGQSLKTGHFVWDNVIFATCDSKQPFVFCPSGGGIIRVGESKYACRIPSATTTSLYAMPTRFEVNELKRILPTQTPQKIQLKKEEWIDLPEQGLRVDDYKSVIHLKTDAPVMLEYQYRVTHPPDIVWKENQYVASSKGGAFLCKRKDFTRRSLAFPEYKVQSFMSDFQ